MPYDSMHLMHNNYFYATIIGPPVITAFKSPMDVGFGADIMITCITDGNPTPSVEWSYVGSETLPFNVIALDRDLYITDVAFSNAGMYQCNASNSRGFNFTTIEIIVHGMYKNNI